MARMERETARQLAETFSIPLDADFHALHSWQVASILEAADVVKYRAPENANGSRARYFHALLKRTAERQS